VDETARLFIADVHLGKLAKALRLLGFDTLYSNAYTPAVLLQLALAENRVLLSRSAALTAHAPVPCYCIKSPDPEVQLQDVVKQFQLFKVLHPFTRCLVCNGQLAPVYKENIHKQLKPNTATLYHEFWQCGHCRHVYWKGAHYQRMKAMITIAEGLAPGT
jgi:uncharacterized protein with PIN domain